MVDSWLPKTSLITANFREIMRDFTTQYNNKNTDIPTESSSKNSGKRVTRDLWSYHWVDNRVKQLQTRIPVFDLFIHQPNEIIIYSVFGSCPLCRSGVLFPSNLTSVTFTTTHLEKDYKPLVSIPMNIRFDCSPRFMKRKISFKVIRYVLPTV